jgi:hypothetical protein
MPKRATILAVLVSLVLSTPASAHRLGPLSEATATRIARAYANREGHRIYRLTYIGIWTTCTAVEYTAACDITLSLHYSESLEVPPVEVTGELAIRKTGPDHYRKRLEREWEVLPAKPPSTTSEAEWEQLKAEGMS